MHKVSRAARDATSSKKSRRAPCRSAPPLFVAPEEGDRHAKNRRRRVREPGWSHASAKHVATHRPESLAWKNSRALGPDPVAKLRALKEAWFPSRLPRVPPSQQTFTGVLL